MYNVTVIFGPGPIAWSFLFKHVTSAKTFFEKFNGTDLIFNLEDEYGQKAAIFSNHIHGVLLEDMDETKNAQIERSLHQARVQLKANQMAQQDPALKFAATMQQPMMQPGNAGR